MSTVRVLPETQMSAPTCSIPTVPVRPTWVPWEAVYAVGARPEPMSHYASPALRLPVTGSSGTP